MSIENLIFLFHCLIIVCRGDLMNTIGEKIKQLRLNKNWTQAELAERSSLSRNSIYKYETGISSPTATALQKIADALNIHLSALLPDLNKYEEVKSIDLNGEEVILNLINLIHNGYELTKKEGSIITLANPKIGIIEFENKNINSEFTAYSLDQLKEIILLFVFNKFNSTNKNITIKYVVDSIYKNKLK